MALIEAFGIPFGLNFDMWALMDAGALLLVFVEARGAVEERRAGRPKMGRRRQARGSTRAR